MLSTQNLLSPASGQPVRVPTQDMVLGVYYLTRPKPGAKGEGRTFGSVDEVLMAWDSGEVETQTSIRLRYNGQLIDMKTAYDEQAITHAETIEAKNHHMLTTTVGRVILHDNMPKGFPFINGLLKKKGLGQLVSYYLPCVTGPEMDGHDARSREAKSDSSYATKAGITISIDDLIVPPGKREFVENASERSRESRPAVSGRAITNGERYNKVIAIWSGRPEKDLGHDVQSNGTRGESESRIQPDLLMADFRAPADRNSRSASWPVCAV
jgi:DNA-directed RNA polymerase subunit beta'